MPFVITENDTSQWEDKTGAVYHFPKRYRDLLTQGAEVIYYKGRITDKAFTSARLSASPHYFGVARIGKVFPDTKSDKGDLFAFVEDFSRFDSAVLAKIDGEYLETIPANRVKNYWRDGVRQISQTDRDTILGRAKLLHVQFGPETSDTEDNPLTFESAIEGSKLSYIGSRYERCQELRIKAIAIHGLECKACGFNFEQVYGEYAKGFIHVHHIEPLSISPGERAVDPKTDLITLCANCHAVVHRRRDRTLSIDELKRMLGRFHD